MEKSAPERCQLDAVLPSVSQENLQSRTAGISGLDASEIHRFFFTVAVPNTSTSTKQGWFCHFYLKSCRDLQHPSYFCWVYNYNTYIYIYTDWWFQTFFIFHNIWDNPSHWLIFFKMVKTTNQYIYIIIYVMFVICIDLQEGMRVQSTKTSIDVWLWLWLRSKWSP